MRFLPTYGHALRTLCAFALVLVMAACDSGSDDETGDPFVGTWELTGVAINDQDFTPFILGTEIDALSADFSSDGTFELTVVSGEDRVVTAGTYTIDEEEETITLTSGRFEQPLQLNYARSGSNRIVLSSTNAALLTELSGIDPGQFGIEVERVDVTISRGN